MAGILESALGTIGDYFGFSLVQIKESSSLQERTQSQRAQEVFHGLKKVDSVELALARMKKVKLNPCGQEDGVSWRILSAEGEIAK